MLNNKDNKTSLVSRKSCLITMFFFAHLVHHLITALQIPLLPFIRSEFNLTYVQAGFLISAFNLSYGISQIPCGWLSDRINTSFMVSIGISGLSICGFLIAMSQSYAFIAILFILMGLLGGAYHPASLPLINAGVTSDYQGQALGIHMIGGSSSYFLAPLFVALLVNNYGWRLLYVWLSIPTLIFGILLYYYTKKLDHTKNKNTSTEKIDNIDTEPTLNCIFRLIPFILLSSFTQAVTFSIIAFIPLFLVDYFNISQEVAATAIAFFYSSGLWASFVGGYLSDRFGAKNLTLIICYASAITIFFLRISPYGWFLFLLLVILGATNYIRFVTSESYLMKQTTDKNRSTIIGLYYFGSMEGGGMLTPILGLLVEHFNFINAFTIAAFSILIITFFFSIFLKKSK
jgi:FSR family fosmidomycin resistance protein-like MFS transporter